MSSAHTLLIVDDCAEDREVYREYLSSDPHNTYEFCEASLAEVALDLFLNQQFDVVLLDFYMPDMTGLEFLGQLKQRQHKLQSPIIMLTGQGNEELAVQAMKHGVQDYLGKQHLQPEILQRTVRSVIQQSHLHVALHKTREQQRLIATTALRIRQSLDLDQILDTAVAEVQQLLECDHVAVYQCNGQETPKIKAELGNRWCPTDDLHPGLDGANPSYRELSAPILINAPPLSQSHTWGYLVAYQCSKVTMWPPEEHNLLHELAVQLAIAIQQAELLSQTQAALEKAQELNQFKSQILATVSHEYRSPLSVILGASSTLDRHGQRLEPSQQSRFLTMIQEKARHMTRLVDNMLVMHQCELDQARFEPAPINILQFVADLVEEHREAATKHELVLQVTGKTGGFWGDQGMLRLAIDNLLSNAFKFSPDGDRIEVHLLGDNSTITVSIKDFGIGIPDDDQPHLFQSFSRASNASHIQGIGLGLSITKACIDLHEGTLGLESQEGCGTKVFFQLPKQPQSLQQMYPTDQG
ncbi:multi-sensor signal transduction histidine kinase [Leptolyngbya sp. Heron Island J]|uniref:sensor histidine kinase n=1 Tax=Leptolyngbya sp. Heron Island J TaxID=1385935 RepID=UPI0003B93CF0|nr:ATP-binding protein [Leptolyngbya sp. Heron Island J]ESA34005.1 multi-sensor signal transduction histidine kinase [Leptolyngbya sp. Heron Island J]